MKKLTTNQKGFELVMVAAVIVVVAVLCASGWLVYKDRYKTRSAAADNTTTAKSSPTPTNSAPSTKPIQSATKYLTVTEWDVSSPLPSSIQNAYYIVPTGETPASDGKPSAVLVSEHSLDTACGVLTNSDTGSENAVGEILRVQPTDVDPLSPGGNGETYSKEYPGGTTVDGWYYVFKGQPANDACSNAPATASVIAGFKSAASSTVSSPAATSAQ